jgi:type IV pilus assembly protein PilP
MAYRYRNPIRSLVLAMLCSGLVACAGNPNADLEEYVKTTKAQQKSSIEPLPEFKPYESFTYAAMDLRDPFTAPTFSTTRAVSNNVASNNGIKPDFDRPSEPLEEFPLDSLRMVGTLEQSANQWALINDTDGTIHRVQPGNYAGQNHGKITRITDFEVELTEIIPDGIGGWIERQSSIAISE